MAPRKREPTATEQIAALNERRHANGGYIIPPTNLSFREWLHAVAEVGHPGDVEIAWHYATNAELKARFENEYVALKEQAGRRYSRLENEAFLEYQRERMASEKRAERKRIDTQIAAYKAAIVSLEQKLAIM